MKKRKILFLGETYRADAITWMNGLRDFGDFEIITWELKMRSSGGVNRLLRLLEYCTAIFTIRRLIAKRKPDMVIAERTTSYGFLAALSGVRPLVIAQQGITDLWPETSPLYPLKKRIQHYAFQKADMIHAWGKIMTHSMEKAHADMKKVLVLPKGIDLNRFSGANTTAATAVRAIVTRSLAPEYRHEIILKAFEILHRRGHEFTLTIVGDGLQLSYLKAVAKQCGIDHKVTFTGRIKNDELPALLHESNYYISTPVTEGVSASLFEAMATCCYPLVSDLPGNRSWISHRENGQLITIDDYEMLASEMMWAIENPEHRSQAVARNRRFVEENANYSVNMKIIAEKYHSLLAARKDQHVRD